MKKFFKDWRKGRQCNNTPASVLDLQVSTKFHPEVTRNKGNARKLVHPATSDVPDTWTDDDSTLNGNASNSEAHSGHSASKALCGGKRYMQEESSRVTTESHALEVCSTETKDVSPVHLTADPRPHPTTPIPSSNALVPPIPGNQISNPHEGDPVTRLSSVPCNNVNITNSSFNEYKGNVNFHVGDVTNVLMDEMDTKLREIPYAKGSRFSPAKACLPGTRTAFLEYISHWADDHDSTRCLVLFGQAGTGKSSIAHEVADRFHKKGQLTSSFIFSRSEQSKHGTHYLFTTLARDLADREPSFKTALWKAIKDDTSLRIGAKDHATLFQSLLLDPLKHCHISRHVLVVIDALDESGHATGRKGLHTFLAERLSELPSNFRILITSRPETDIECAFTGAASVDIIRMDDPVLAMNTPDDIRIYLEGNLPRDVFHRHGTKLATKAEGIFQWAAVACVYIYNPPFGLTKNKCILRLLEPASTHDELDPLHSLYHEIISAYFSTIEAQQRFRVVMGHVLAASEPLSMRSLSMLWQHAPVDDADDDEAVYAIVRHLGSLLSNVASPDSRFPVVPLHSSFHDFLTNEKSSGPFYVDVGEAHHQLAHACLGLMKSQLRFNICNLESSYFPNRSIFDLETRIDQHITHGLSYACRFWNDHLGCLGFDDDLLAKVCLIFKQKFLFWLEVLSLTNSLGLAMPALLSLKKWLALGQENTVREIGHAVIRVSNDVKELEELVSDANLFLRNFGMIIAASAPHIYVSALPFTPIACPISRIYSRLFPQTESFVKRGRLEHWARGTELIIATGGQDCNSVAFSPDGQGIISGSRDGTVRVWNATTGVMEGDPLTGHTGPVTSVAFSPDGRQIVSGSWDHSVRVWNATTGARKGNPFIGHTNRVTSVMFSPDGQRIVSGSWDHSVRVWNAAKGTMEGEPLTGHTGPVTSVAFSPDGQRIVSGSWDNAICVWDISNGIMEGGPLTGCSGWVTSTIFSPDGQWIVSGSENGAIDVWKPDLGVITEALLTGHNDYVSSLTFSPDGQWIVSGSWDQSVRMWSATTGAMNGDPLTGHTGPVTCVAFSPDGQRIASASEDGTIRVWNAVTRATNDSSLMEHISWHIQSAPQPRILGSVAAGQQWDAPAEAIKGGLSTRDTDYTPSVAFSPDGWPVVSGSWAHSLHRWNVLTGAMEKDLSTGRTGGDWSEETVIGFENESVTRINASDQPTNMAMHRVHCTDRLGINQDGWICGSKGELLLWIPGIHRWGLDLPDNVRIGGVRSTQVDFSRLLHGPQWINIQSTTK